MKRGPNWKREVYVPIVDPITRKFISAAVYEANKLEAAVKNADNREEKAHGRSDVMARVPPEEAVWVRKKKKRPSECKDGVPAIAEDRTTGRFKRNEECDEADTQRRRQALIDEQCRDLDQRDATRKRNMQSRASSPVDARDNT
jgi:hypothetical protein